MKMIFLLVAMLLISHCDVRGHAFLSRLNNSCPGNLCPNDYTCCDTRRGFYACCPLSMATCCRDGATCCPEGYTCSNTQPTTCSLSGVSTLIGLQVTQVTANQKRLKILGRRSSANGKGAKFDEDVPASERGVRFVKTFIANRRKERITRVNSPSNQKTGALINISEPANETRERLSMCGSSVCVENHPCCNSTTPPMCCSFSNGVCCEDKLYCCPHQYICDWYTLTSGVYQ